MSASMGNVLRFCQGITQVLENNASILRGMHDLQIRQLSIRGRNNGVASGGSMPSVATVGSKQMKTSVSRRNFPNKLCASSSFRLYSTERFCWKCGRGTLPWEYFFCDCGMVQSPACTVDYFSLFGMKMDFDIDTHKLSTLYKDLQQKLHPDKYTQKSEDEKHLAGEQSSLVNKAYFTLLKPLSRGLYMLDLHGCPIEEASGKVDADFLMEILEMNERLDSAETDQEVKEIEDEIFQLIRDGIVEISHAFRNQDFSEAKRLIVRYKYFGNINDKIRERHRSAM